MGVEECFEVPSEAPSKSNPKFSKWKRSTMNETSGGGIRSERSSGWAKSQTKTQTKTICRLVPVKQCSDREVCEQVPREKCTKLPVKTCWHNQRPSAPPF